MNKLRAVTPKRRKNVKKVNKYSDYKGELRVDFNERCGYCDDIDKWRDSFYEIDHFVPKKYLKTISVNDYRNLVYSCRYCNNSKRAKWPTKDEQKANNGSEGFIDPCSPSYDEQFYRNKLGEIKYRTPLGEYMYKAMKLYLKRHSITWNIERLAKLIKEMKKILEKGDDRINKEDLLALYGDHERYIEDLHNQRK